MDAIQAVSSGVRDLADGSLKITFEFEPKDAINAFKLFGQRGTAVAIAGLIPEHEQQKVTIPGFEVNPLDNFPSTNNEHEKAF